MNLTIADFAKRLGTSRTMVLYGALIGQIPGLHMTNYMWFLPESSLLSAQQFLNNQPNIISIQDAVKKYGISKASIWRWCDGKKIQGAIKLPVLGWSFPETSFQTFIINNSFTLLEISKKNKVSTNEALRWIEEEGRFPNAKKINNQWYVPKMSLWKANSFLDPSIIYLTIPEVMNISGLSYETIKTYCKNGGFPDIKLYNNKWHIPKANLALLKSDNYFNISSLKKQLKCEIKTINALVEDGTFSLIPLPSGKFGIPKEQVYRYESIKKNLYTMKEVVAYTGIGSMKILRLLREEKINGYQRKRWYIDKQSIDNYFATFDRSENLIVKDIAKKEGIPEKTVLRRIWSGYFPVEQDPRNGEYYIKEEDYKNWLLKSHKYKNVDELFEYETRDFQTPGKIQTLKLYHLFYIEKISKSNAARKIDYAHFLVRSYHYIINQLPKEIYLLENAEIEHILMTLSNPTVKLFINFLNWVYAYRNGQCAYTPSFKLKEKELKLDEIDGIYSLDQFTQYIQFTKDIKINVPRAIKSYKNCLSWLFILLHITNAWRKEDYYKIPNIQIEEIGVTSLAWFANNSLTTAQSIKIILQIRRHRNQLVAGKNNAFLHFFCNEDMLVPMASALVIAELHRRARRNETIFTNHPTYDNLSDFTAFGKLPVFGSRKMNKTLMTYITKESDFIGIGLILAQIMRSHTNPNSAQVYVRAMHKDGPANTATIMLFNRGHFGWLYDSLLNIIAGCNPVLLGIESKNDRTQAIQAISATHTPLQIELITEFIQQQNIRRKSLITELMTISREELKMKLIAIYNGHMPAKTLDAQCLIYPDCPNPVVSSCIYCKYVIPRQFLLANASDETIKTLQRFTRINIFQTMERMKNTILFLKCMDIINQGLDYFPEDYVASMVDYDGIRPLIEACSDKFLLYSGENNGKI